jgi:hypothetical protein
VITGRLQHHGRVRQGESPPAQDLVQRYKERHCRIARNLSFNKIPRVASGSKTLGMNQTPLCVLCNANALSLHKVSCDSDTELLCCQLWKTSRNSAEARKVIPVG